jgi:DNA-binding Xre family transcriptional regulator
MIASPSMPVRFRLQALLDEQNPPITQTAVARASGVSQVTVNAIARNRTEQVSLSTLDKLCAGLSKLLRRRVEPGELLVRGRG